MKKNFKGFTLIELIISLGLLLIIVLSVTTLAFYFTRYQAKRIEKVQVQENFRNSIKIITEELNNINSYNILEPATYVQDKEFKDISFELIFTPDGNTVVRYHIVTIGRESQVFRKVYNNNDSTPINRGNWFSKKVLIMGTETSPIEPTENEPISDKIKALSHLLFTYNDSEVYEGVTIFMVGELISKAKVSYVSLAYPRN